MLTKYLVPILSGLIPLLLLACSTAAPPVITAPTPTPEPLLTDTSTPTPIPLPTNTPTPALGQPPASLPPWVSVSAPGTTPVLTATPYVPPASPLTSSQTQTISRPDNSTTPTPESSLTYPGDEPLDVAEIERWVVVLVNEERAKVGVPPLVSNQDVVNIARAHSENMYRQGRTSNKLDGKGSKDRAREAGYNYCTGFVGNVIKHPRIQRFATKTSSGFVVSGRPTAYGADSEAVARNLVSHWMGSPSQENILKSKYQSTGVGVYIDVGERLGWAWETVYATQNFSGCSR